LLFSPSLILNEYKTYLRLKRTSLKVGFMKIICLLSLSALRQVMELPHVSN
jgi:hypothetical protein